MINRLKNLENNFSLSKATFIVGFFTLASRLIGLVRDRLFASHFGAGDTLDVYYAAFRLPDLVFNLLVLGTLSVAFIPVFAELLAEDKDRAYKVANTVLNVSAILMAIVALILLFFIKDLTHLIVPGFSGVKFDETAKLTRLFLLSPIIFTVSNVFSSILNAQKKFIITGIAPLMYNLGIIFGLLYLYPHYGLLGLGWGVIVGALCHLLIQIPETIRHGFNWSFIFDIKDKAFLKITKLFIPRIFGVDNSQISLLIGSIVGSFLSSGSIAIFNLANNLQAVPLGIFAISASVAAFPLFSETFAKKDEKGFINLLGDSVIQILYFIIPITILMLLFRAHLVRLVYGAGKFSWTDTILTFNALGIFSFSLFSQALQPLFARAFYARQNTLIPVVVNGLSMVLNAALAFYFAKIGWGVSGIAAGFSAASILGTLILFILLRKKIHDSSSEAKEYLIRFDRNLISAISKILFSSIVMGLSGYAMLYLLAPFLNTRKVYGLFIQACLAGLVSIAVFIVISSSLNLAPSKALVKRLRFFNRT